MTHLLFLLVLAALEATVVSLPLVALTRFALPWPLLLAVTIFGWLADTLTLRLPTRFERLVLGVGALLATTCVLAVRLGGVSLVVLLPGSAQFGLAYGLALVALYMYWRGTRLAARGSDDVSGLFGRSAVLLVFTLLVAPLVGTGTPLGGSTVLAHVLGFVSLGLFVLALARASEESARGSRLGWRWLLSIGLAIGCVLLLGALVATLLGGGAAIVVVQNMLRLLLLPFALVGGLVVWLLVSLLAEPLIALVQALLAQLALIRGTVPPPDLLGAASADEGATQTSERLANGATFLLALVPIIILVALMLLLRGRARRRSAADEERESLGVAANLAGDLRNLLGSLRNPFARRALGLRAALAALRGDDPSTRVRRAYVRLLLRLEERARPRLLAQTPAEFAPVAAGAVGAPQVVADLTAAYERARYDPAGASAADAAAAEGALRSMPQGESRFGKPAREGSQ